ncbi:unnamed protein product [Paramecium primaurelia]|uniref:Transmembrane protein n=1 Tax=Paramecium primaurelia TaxID=5886 RepID=A0A8S1M5H7_PARPR|nr:unnamed protein product [Paramecium primaurelia]
MKQITDNDNYSVDGWNFDEQSNFIKYTKFVIPFTILINIYLIVITFLYKTIYPPYFYEILLYSSIYGISLSIFNIFWKQEKDSVIRQLSFVLNGLMIIMAISLIIFFIASFEADYNYKIGENSSYINQIQEWQHFTLLFRSILLSLFLLLISYFYITYSLYLCQDQQNLMIALHIYNTLFFITGIAINHYSKLIGFQLILLLLLISTSTLVYSANLKKIKVAYFTIGAILLFYLILNQYQHFLNVRQAKQNKISVLNDCSAHLRNLHMDFLFANTICQKYQENVQCNDDQKAFMWELDTKIPISQRDTKLGCLNLNCCGIVADRSKFKLNVISLVHQLIGFATLTLILYISQKPPLLNTEIKIYDFIFGTIQLFLIIITIFLFSKEINQDINKFNSLQTSKYIDIPKGCSQMKNFITLNCQFIYCDNIELTIKTDYPMNYYRLSNSKDFYVDDSNFTELKFIGKFDAIQNYIYSNIYMCVTSKTVNIDFTIKKSTRLLKEISQTNLIQNQDILKTLQAVRFWKLQCQLNINQNYTIKLLNPITNTEYLQIQNQNTLNFVQEQSYILIIQSKGYIPYEQNIFINKDTLLNINLIKQQKQLSIILQGSKQSMLGTTFATSIYKQYTTTKWVGSNNYMHLEYIDDTTQIIKIDEVDYPILVFIINPNYDALLSIYDEDRLLYKSYTNKQINTQQVLCLQGNTINYLKSQTSNKLLPNSLICQ